MEGVRRSSRRSSTSERIEVARFIAITCVIVAAALAAYDTFARHAPLTSFRFDWYEGTGFVLAGIGLVAAIRIKPKGRE